LPPTPGIVPLPLWVGAPGIPNMKIGVLLFNLGGPESLGDVRPFLYTLFSDPEIIRIKNDVLRRMLAWLIATARQGKSRNLYRQIGGGSPLRKITENQAEALSAALRARGVDARVFVGMRCWKPTIDDAVDRILKEQISRLVLLPLFPQYSVTTTGSCLKYFQSLDRKIGLSSRIRISTIQTWFDDPLYLECMATLIREELQAFPSQAYKPVHLLYSAHSIPASYIDEGDPYLDQTRRTVELLNGRLGNEYPYTLAFQSKVGPVKWLSPSTSAVLKMLGQDAKTSVLTVPISFVSDHIETLQEIDIAYREVALASGIREFRRIPALNVHPEFIAALANLVMKAGI
jgi:protoporphyrin/coproporphyrin ferrochelatase